MFGIELLSGTLVWVYGPETKLKSAMETPEQCWKSV